MRRLIDRTDIAKAINFGKYPVIKIDLADRDDYGIRGTKVNIDFGGEYFIHGKIRSYDDERCLTATQGATCLSKEIYYDDYLEMVEYANAPTIKANQEIVIFMYNSMTKEVFAPAIITTGKIDRFCSTPITLEKFIIG
jgi:hypothetical protein